MDEKMDSPADPLNENERMAGEQRDEISVSGDRMQTVSSRKRSGLRAQIRAALPFSSAGAHRDDYGQHDAELFYLHKQIQQQTQMVVVLEDNRQIHGVIEWYDRNTIKIRGRQRVLVYKSAIKYLYKQGENGGIAMQ